MELDAAQALLDLHNSRREIATCNLRQESHMDQTEDVVETANLYLSCFFPSNDKIDSPTRISVANVRTFHMSQLNNRDKMTTRGITTNKTVVTEDSSVFTNPSRGTGNSTITSEKDSECKLIRSLKIILDKHLLDQFEDSQMIKNKYDITDLSPTPDQNNKCNVKKTRDMGTQTVDNDQSYKINIMEFTIQHLSERIKGLEKQLNATDINSHVIKEENPRVFKNREGSSSSDETPLQHMYYNKHYVKKTTSNVNENLCTDIFPCVNEKWGKENTTCKLLNDAKSNDLVPIGKGRAQVSARLLRHINWNSYTSATRKLLTAIFPRRVLATHSLTGKRSPAFPKKQPKKKLDVNLVQDIVQTVVDRCSVPENVVRTSITNKCADESKMYRTRMLNTQHMGRRTRKNKSSESPDTDYDSVN